MTRDAHDTYDSDDLHDTYDRYDITMTTITRYPLQQAWRFGWIGLGMLGHQSLGALLAIVN